MSKVYIEFDTPLSCFMCPFYFEGYCYIYDELHGYPMDVGDYDRYRSPLCPLKEVEDETD